MKLEKEITMGLSCSCPDWDGDGWYYIPASEDFTKLNTKTRKRCCSCKELIDVGADSLKFKRCRGPISDVEERICGDEVRIAPWYMCEKCGEQYMNLEDLGYCIYIGDNMFQLLEEYKEMQKWRSENA